MMREKPPEVKEKMQRWVQSAINYTNGAFIRSKIAARLKLVHSSEVSYDEPSDISASHDRLMGRDDGFFDFVHQLRNETAADLVILIVENVDDYCGKANVLDELTVSNEHRAFAVVARSCEEFRSEFAHEVGHLFGGQHDWHISSTSLPFPYSHGFINFDEQWRTIMAKIPECVNRDIPCHVIPYYSNPDLTYNGSPIGTSIGQQNPTDNRRTINQTASSVASYRLRNAPPEC